MLQICNVLWILTVGLNGFVFLITLTSFSSHVHCHSCYDLCIIKFQLLFSVFRISISFFYIVFISIPELSLLSLYSLIQLLYYSYFKVHTWQLQYLDIFAIYSIVFPSLFLVMSYLPCYFFTALQMWGMKTRNNLKLWMGYFPPERI